MIFSSKVVKVGAGASRFFDEGIILLFSSDSVMTQIKNYSVTIDNIVLNDEIKEDQFLVIGTERFLITAVGNIAQSNLLDIGHATIKADGSKIAELPGTIYVEERTIPELKSGDCILIES